MNTDILLIDKPRGITSFDVIRILRKKLGIRKMGHAGTLDPLASGLLIIGVESGTKKLNEYLKLPKVYEAEILLGRKTETGDLEGKVIEEKKGLSLDEKDVVRVVDTLVGEILLPVPIFSAIKMKGQPLYKRARRGEKITGPKKIMEITKIKFLELRKEKDFYLLRLILYVKSGTYIRSIAEEIGERLKIPATLSGLRRIQIGNFTIDKAQKV